MRFTRLFGGAMLLASMGLVFGQGFGVPRKEDIPKYIKQLQTSKNAADRVKAVQMIGKRGGVSAPDVADAIEPLQKTLEKDIDAKVRAAAARALGDIHPQPEKTIPILIDRVKGDSAMEVKIASAIALGQYGPDAREAVGPLRELQKKFDPKKMAKDFQTIQNSLQAIGAGKKKKKE
jgi:HEAT repeat protein